MQNRSRHRAAFGKPQRALQVSGANLDDIQTMKRALIDYDAFPRVQIKAAGGIRKRQGRVCHVASRATRLGTSRGVELMHELQGSAQQHTPSSNYYALPSAKDHL